MAEHLIFTGAAGYIGSNTALTFLENTTHQILIIDNLSTGFSEHVRILQENFSGRVHFFHADLRDTEKISEIFARREILAVVHFAASLSVFESTQNPLLYYENNLQNTINLAKICLKNGVKNFIFSSTAAVYGEPNLPKIPENTPLDPINPYGRSKMASEIFLRDMATHGLKTVVLRYFNVAGANENFMLGQRGLASHLIKIACECAVKKREKLQIFGCDYATPDGSCVRDYVHVSDLARAHLSAFWHLLRGGNPEIFNVGYGRGFSVLEIISVVQKISGENFVCEYAPRRSGDPASLVSCARKISEITDFSPRENLETIIKSALFFEKNFKNL